MNVAPFAATGTGNPPVRAPSPSRPATFFWRRHAHDRFVGFDVYNFLVIRNFIARLHFNIDDCGFGDRFA